MKTFRMMLIGLAALLALSSPAYAQRLLDNTTLAANLSDTATTVTLTSNDAAAVGEFIVADREVMRITSVSTTDETVTVQRGQGGTAAGAHDNAETAFVVAGGDLKTVDPSYGADCTRGTGQAAVLPWINTRNGNIWKCLPSGVWNGTNTMLLTYNSIQTGAL